MLADYYFVKVHADSGKIQIKMANIFKIEQGDIELLQDFVRQIPKRKDIATDCTR